MSIDRENRHSRRPSPQTLFAPFLWNIAVDTCELATMSMPLSMAYSQVRKRVGFKANTDGLPNDRGDQIIDEQGIANPRSTASKFPADLELEQDQVIDDIRHQMVKSDLEHQVGIGIITLLSCALWAFPPFIFTNTTYIRIRHVIHLFNPLQPPTAVLFTASDTNSPIPLNIVFTYIHLCLQGYLCISIFHPPTDRKVRTYFSSAWSNARNSIGYVPLVDPHLFPLLISSIAPILSVFLRKGWANFTWWCFCGTLFSIHLFVQRGRLHDEARIERLEKLKYRAKGA